MKYDTIKATGFWLPDSPTESSVHFMDVIIATGSWDEIEDSDDERIFFYMDGKELNEGDIISEGFVIVEIDSGDDNE
jgi:hypothetical protein